MIKKLKHREIDFTKYNKCLAQSLQQNLYAQKENLDFLCDEWELLVSGDYDFVMPIPIKKKLGLKIVAMPLFCQQLGVFSKEIDEDKELQFLDYFTKNYKILSYSFNHFNLKKSDLHRKKNYSIERTEYSALRKNYFKGRKSTVKTAQYLSFAEIKLDSVLVFIRNNFKGLDKKQDSDKFFSYLKFLEARNELKLFGSFKDTNLTNVAILVDSGDKFSLLGLINNDEFKADNGASFLVDKILQDYISHKAFDFMGGSIRGIEVFFKSFGSTCEEYPIITHSKKDLIKNIFKK